jgi:hypothetical protein
MTIRNVGRMEAGVRIIAGTALLGVAMRLNARPFAALAAAAVAVLVLGSGLLRSCPLYVLLGMSTASPTEAL